MGRSADVNDGSGIAKRRWRIAQQVVLAVVGGYALTSALTAVAALGLSALMPRSEAVVLMGMLAFVIYLVVLIWAFAEPRLHRLWGVLGFGGGGGFSVLWLLGAGG